MAVNIIVLILHYFIRIISLLFLLFAAAALHPIPPCNYVVFHSMCVCVFCFFLFSAILHSGLFFRYRLEWLCVRERKKLMFICKTFALGMKIMCVFSVDLTALKLLLSDV
jgi:hypothetical protein